MCFHCTELLLKKHSKCHPVQQINSKMVLAALLAGPLVMACINLASLRQELLYG